MITKVSIEKLIENNLLQLMDKRGIIIDGYPRDIAQLREFEEKVKKYNHRQHFRLLSSHYKF